MLTGLEGVFGGGLGLGLGFNGLLEVGLAELGVSGVLGGLGLGEGALVTVCPGGEEVVVGGGEEFGVVEGLGDVEAGLIGVDGLAEFALQEVGVSDDTQGDGFELGVFGGVEDVLG